MARSSRTSGKTSMSKTRKPRGTKGRNPGRSKENIAPTTIRLRRSSGSELGKELQQAREQQAATSEVIEAIPNLTLSAKSEQRFVLGLARLSGASH
jgi:hypothetical protein